MFWHTWKSTHFLKFKIKILKKAHLGFMGSFDMLFLVLKANYGEKISLLGISSLVNTNAPGLIYKYTNITSILVIIYKKNCKQFI